MGYMEVDIDSLEQERDMQEQYGNDMLKARVTDEQREAAKRLAQHKGVGISQLIRDLIRADFEAAFPGEEFPPDETKGKRKIT